MARIEFPIASFDGELFKREGVLYQYQGTPPNGFWAANTQNILIDAFVDSAGDVMSGDLTISNLAGTGNAGVGVDSTGKLIRTDPSSNLVSPFVNITGDTVSGTIHFENSLGNITLSLYHQSGVGSFKGDLTSGDFDVNTPSTASASGGGIVGGGVYAKRSDSNSFGVFTGYNVTGDNTSTIYGDGGAEFGTGNISLTAAGSVKATAFSAEGQYQSASGIRSTVKDEDGAIGQLVLGDGTVAIGGTLAAYPGAGTPNILLSSDGSVICENLACTDAAFSGNITISRGAASDNILTGQQNGLTKVSISAGGDSTFNDVTLNDISGQSGSFTSSLTAGAVTLSDTGIAISGANSDVIELDNTGRGTFAGDVHLSGTLFAGDISVSGAISASSFGAISGTTAQFSGQISADDALLHGDLAAGDLDVLSIAATDITASGNLSVTGSGLFSDQKISFSTDGSIVTHSGGAGLELGTTGSGPDISMLKGFAGSTGASTGTERFSFTGDGAVSLASGSCNISTSGDVQNVNNSYGAISDRKFKEDITPAKSQWDDIKAVKLVNYSFKPELGWGTGRKLGVVSQDLRQVCPALVDVKKEYKEVTTPVFDDQGMPVVDEEGSQLYETITQATGSKTESVKYSVLYLKAIGALQEAMERIESLESTIKSLKG